MYIDNGCRQLQRQIIFLIHQQILVADYQVCHYEGLDAQDMVKVFFF